jgi:DNA helicase-2/ATP-dependent DNA helicase PcrA
MVVFPAMQKRKPIPFPELIKEILPKGDYHLEEERRLFYVALTRAKKLTYLTASLFYAEGKKKQKISTFVNEALGEDQVKKQSLLKKEEKTQLSIFDYKKPSQSIKKKFQPSTTFSYSQINNYQLCPLQYKYHYIFKIPTLPNAAATFGESIHKTHSSVSTKIFRKTKKSVLKSCWLSINNLGFLSVIALPPNNRSRKRKEKKCCLYFFLLFIHIK